MATWTAGTKHSASYSGLSKSSDVWDSLGTDLLLMEDKFALLQECSIGNASEFQILLEQTGSIASSWSNLSKN